LLTASAIGLVRFTVLMLVDGGVLDVVVPPLPNCPLVLAPQQRMAFPEVPVPLPKSKQLKLPPAATIKTLLGTLVVRLWGIKRAVVVPSPKRLLVLLPQHFRLEDDSVMQVCWSPAEMLMTNDELHVRQVVVVFTTSGCTPSEWARAKVLVVPLELLAP
jgi:hypothetical protein